MNTARSLNLLILILIGLATCLQGHGQTAGPGCKPPYYEASFGPPADGSMMLNSSTVGPDGCIYIGSLYYPDYSIIKLDTFGALIRSTAYLPPGSFSYPTSGKTIIDYDGNLLSVMFNNYILKTDTLGNILSSKQLSFINPGSFTFLDVAVLSNGDKVFLLDADLGAFQYDFVVLTTPDLSSIIWTKYWGGYSYSYTNVAMLADGDKIILGFDFYNSYNYYEYPNNSGILALDGGTGAVLQQRWFSQILNFSQVSRYNNGYLFNGRIAYPSNASFYIRTDNALNVQTAYDFPSYTTGYPFLFRPQPDGSIYGFYSSTSSMELFFISAGDVVEWASGLFGFYQIPVTMSLSPGGIFVGTDWSANDVTTNGGPLSGIELYRTSYSGYFPPCTNPTPATMSSAPFSLTPTAAIDSIRDTTALTISASSIQEVTGPTLAASTCTGTPACNSVQIAGNATLCSSNGSFTASLNNGCTVPLSWSVSDGPGTGAITINNNNAVSISFSQDGAYKLKAAFSANCTIYADSITVHVTATSAHLSLGDDTTLCSGASLILHAGNNFTSYAWQDGSTDSTLLVTAPGHYTVNTQDYCGNPYNSSVNIAYWPVLSSPYPSNLGKCLIDTLSLPLPTGFDSVYFQTPPPDGRIRNDSVQLFNLTSSTYALEVRDDHGCQIGSNITVQIYAQPSIGIGNDRTICPGDSILLDPGPGLANYQWSTGSQNQTIWATSGAYWVQTVTADGCIDRASMELTNYPAPVARLDDDTVLCTGATRLLSPGDGFASYRWNDGSTNSTLPVGATGQYWVNVTDAQGCSTADTVTIKNIDPLPANFLPADTTICQYGSEIIKPDGVFSSYLWSDGSAGASISVKTPGLYTLQVTDKYGCSGSDSILLTGKQCLIGCYVPSAFTPDGNGKNDSFRPLLYGEVVGYKFAVFNRWGQLVFESTEPSRGWDGNIQGVPQPAGTFVWYCYYQLQGEPQQMQKGTVLLIR